MKIISPAALILLSLVSALCLPDATHQPPRTSPTNGRRSVATTTPGADTHRDPVRREAADSINSAKAIALNVGSRKEVDISSVKRNAMDYANIGISVVLVGAVIYAFGYGIYASVTEHSPPKHPKNRRSNCVEEAPYSNKHSGAVQANRRRSSAATPGDRNTLLFPMQVRYDEHFDSKDAIRMVMRTHSKAEDKKNDKSEPHAPQGRRDVGTQRLGSAL
ncbi:hypothetical protein A4X06_0g1254 [Tilletia controversa]|uniref:Transmembrane protein n=3 Tax=Tilletia TaxID=13289 RepID=A0A8X7MXV3_9BASI|nr:hypothetical protein CF328_g1346 [Tilletia controversa]KAE8253709.1 hypothetical protein A4X06_0g1254 [Tilletia controversa]